MPYKQHNFFENSDDKDDTIWRYIDFTKFVSILTTNSLYFPKAKVLMNLDRYETSVPQKELDFRLNWYKKFIESEGRVCTDEDLRLHAQSWINGFEEIRNTTFINCWHKNDIESMALWKIYAGESNGIAIKSSTQRLRKSFKDYPIDVFIGDVQYIDFENQIYQDVFKDKPPSFNLFQLFLTKHHSFEFEKEHRAIVANNGESGLQFTENSDGLYVPANLDILIDKIVLSPQSPIWFSHLVMNVCKKFSLGKDISKSILDKDLPSFKIK